MENIPADTRVYRVKAICELYPEWQSKKRLVLLNEVLLKIGTHFTMLSMTKMLEYMCTLILHNGTVQQESKILLRGIGNSLSCILNM